MIKIGKVRGKNILFDFSKAENGSVLITGTSGMGKTTMLFSLIGQESQNSKIVIFDTLGNFTQVAQLHDSSVFDLSETGLNMKSLFKCEFEALDLLRLANIAKGVSSMYGEVFGMGATQKNVLYAATKNTIIAKNEANLQQICKELQDMESVTAQNVYAKLEYAADSRLLEGTLDVLEAIKNNRIVILNLQGINPDMRKLMVEMILNILQENARNQNIRNVKIVLDEAQNYRYDKNAMLSKLLVEGRNYGIGIWLATQYLTDRFPSASINCFCQAALHVYFKPVSDERARILKDLSNDKEERRKWGEILEELSVGECIVKGCLLKEGEKKFYQQILKIKRNLDDIGV